MPPQDKPRTAGPNRYKVIKGEHVHSDGRTYTEGQVVTSNDPLDQMFPNKFLREFPGEDLPPAVPSLRPTPPPGEKGEKERESDDPRKPGQVPSPLAEDAEKTGVTAESELDGKQDDKDDKQTDKDEKSAVEPPGEEVTDDFQMAGLRGLKVFKVGGNSFVVTAEDDVGTPLVQHPMTKSATQKWVKDYEPKE